MKKAELIGQRFGKLEVVEKRESSKSGHTRWLCRCDCGNETVVFATNLKRGLVVSCGCERIEKSRNRDHTDNLREQKFNRLTAIEPIGKSKKGEVIWKCQCDCGNITNVKGTHLKGNRVKSCGCLRTETKTHGLSKKEENKRLYGIWTGIKQRCYNPKREKYARYGGRGIRVCDEWLSDFQAFYDWAMAHGYTDELTIDRIDNDGNYEPSNCRWVTSSENTKHRWEAENSRWA